MLDEGIAREVVNRVQKLRKKAKLQPSDKVTVQYKLEPPNHDLNRIINVHKEYIETTTKNPMTTELQKGEMLIEEQYELKGAKMTLKITIGQGPSLQPTTFEMTDFGKPNVPYVNVVCEGKCGVLLLENPIGSNKLTNLTQVRN